jgi:hypothetical protein
VKNQDVIDAFLAGTPARTANLSSTGHGLETYSTLLAYHDRDNGVVLVNQRPYSKTSSTHRNALMRLIGEHVPDLDTTVSMYQPYAGFEPVPFHAFKTER